MDAIPPTGEGLLLGSTLDGLKGHVPEYVQGFMQERAWSHCITWAAEQRHLEVLQELIQAGTALDMLDYAGRAALDVAKSSRRTDVDQFWS